MFYLFAAGKTARDARAKKCGRTTENHRAITGRQPDFLVCIEVCLTYSTTAVEANVNYGLWGLSIYL